MRLSNTNLSLYKSFLAVFESGSTQAASRVLHIGQTAVSRNIKSLESELNTKLFIAHPRGLKPTRVATDIYPHIKKAMFEISYAEDLLANDAELQATTLRIGCKSFVASYILLDFLCEFKEKYPQIKLEIVTRKRAELFGMAEIHDLDVVVDMAKTHRDDNMIVRKLADLPLTFFASRDFVKQNGLGTTLTMENLMDLPLVFIDSKTFISEELSKHLGVELKPAIEAGTSELLFALVNRGMGVGYDVKECLAHANVDNLVALGFERELPTTPLNVMVSKMGASMATRVFVEELVKFAEEKKKSL
ncbi:MAG: LysR family transcriptional regulator [Firmicutes bacterium]|nr:LysR family transcriptional regulator [Bacillota bacterium]